MLRTIAIFLIVSFAVITTATAQNKVVVIPMQGDESTWQGAWQFEHAYAKGDVVEAGGSSYIALVAHMSGQSNSPPSMGTWDLVASAGAPGSAGTAGAPGPSGTPGHILGTSSQSSNGRFSFNGEFGLRAADEMCKATFNNDPSAHLCSHAEVQNAISTGQYDQYGPQDANRISGVTTWTVSSSSENGSFFSGSSANSCHYLGYNSGDTSVGTRLRVELAYLVPGNGGGVTIDHYQIQSNIACNQYYPVMCCR